MYLTGVSLKKKLYSYTGKGEEGDTTHHYSGTLVFPEGRDYVKSCLNIPHHA